MSAHAILRWNGAGLAEAERDFDEGDILVADSWLVTQGTVLAIDLHRERFIASAARRCDDDVAAFWNAAIDAIPREGEWFPRVELRRTGADIELLLRLRPAPQRGRSVVLATHSGEDPRTQPTTKGPSLDTLERLRSGARIAGADDIVIVDELGHIVEGASTAIAWWRGDILCIPAPELDRVDSVTARAVAALAAATGTQLSWETTTPEELDGLEIWTLNALHGIRIVTRWIDGPAPAQEPRRLDTWRARMDALRRPLPAQREVLV